MADPQSETILVALKTAFETITTTNGYQTTVAEVVESLAPTPPPLNRPAIYFYSDMRQRSNYVFGKSEATLNINVISFVDGQPDDFTNARKLEADIERLLGSSTNWTYFQWTEITSSNIYFGGVQEIVAVIHTLLTISYRYNFGDP